jgi:hypothetical protein
VPTRGRRFAALIFVRAGGFFCARADSLAGCGAEYALLAARSTASPVAALAVSAAQFPFKLPDLLSDLVPPVAEAD